MLKLLAGLVIVGTIGLFGQAAIAETSDFRSTGFQEIDHQNGVVTDSRGFRSSWVSTGNQIGVGPGVVVVPHRHPRLVIAPVVRSPGIVIAPTFNFGGNPTTCTTTNTVTSSDGTVFRSSTTQPCGF